MDIVVRTGVTYWKQKGSSSFLGHDFTAQSFLKIDVPSTLMCVSHFKGQSGENKQAGSLCVPLLGLLGLAPHH